MIGYNAAGCGGRHESQIDDCNEVIQSKNIVSFSYVGTDYNVFAKKEGNMTHIFATGGGKYNKRDGSYFIIKYDTEDDSIFTALQEIIDKNHETHGNGHCVNVDGLPAGIGDTLNVIYDTGEKIYKYSNQCITVNPESVKDFYEVFHSFVKKDGYEFNSSGSNVKLYDDADEEYVQGTWRGKHFGDDIEVTFNEKFVTIKVNDKITDENVEYIIVEGFIQKNTLRDGKDGTSKYDYDDFNGVQCFSKKNWFTMTGYFHVNSSSSCDLMNFDKEEPVDENN